MRTPGLKERLLELEAHKAKLEMDLDAPTPAAPRLHPNLAEVYRRKVCDLHSALAEPDTHTEAIAIVRDLIDKIIVAPADGGFEVELAGSILQMLELAQQETDAQGAAVRDFYRSSVKVVAGARNQLCRLFSVHGLLQVF